MFSPYFNLDNLGLIVQRPISANPILIQVSFFLHSGSLLQHWFFPFLFRASSDNIVDKNNLTEFFLELSDLK